MNIKFIIVIGYRNHLRSILRKSQKPGFSRYFSSPTQKLVETRFLAPGVNLRNRVSLDISRHPTQKLVETRFLAPGVNLRNRVSLDISRHPTQKLKDVKWVLYSRLNLAEEKIADSPIDKTEVIVDFFVKIHFLFFVRIHG